jgi:hypothetical protein
MDMAAAAEEAERHAKLAQQAKRDGEQLRAMQLKAEAEARQRMEAAARQRAEATAKAAAEAKAVAAQAEATRVAMLLAKEKENAAPPSSTTTNVNAATEVATPAAGPGTAGGAEPTDPSKLWAEKEELEKSLLRQTKYHQLYDIERIFGEIPRCDIAKVCMVASVFVCLLACLCVCLLVCVCVVCVTCSNTRPHTCKHTHARTHTPGVPKQQEPGFDAQPAVVW